MIDEASEPPTSKEPDALPHPEGWVYLGQTREERPFGEVDGKPITMLFLFNNYYRTQDDTGKTRLSVMQIQVHE